MVDVGDPAPDFVLRDQDRQEVRLSDLRGKKVVIVFYPFSFSGICQSELCEIRDDITDYSNERVQTLADLLRLRAGAEGVGRRAGADLPGAVGLWPHGEVARAYGAFHEGAGAAVRGTFVVDEQGVVVHKVLNDLGEKRDHAPVLAALA